MGKFKNIAIDLEESEKLKAHLDEHIVGQDRAKKALSVAVYN